MIAIAPLEWPGMNQAFLTTLIATLVLSLAIIPYGKRRPVGAPFSWGEAMLASTYIFGVLFLAFGIDHALRRLLRRRLRSLRRDLLALIEQLPTDKPVVLVVNKIDVDEELSRLATHLDELDRILKKGGAAGKRLDFLMQELNREANTLGSKSADIEVTRVAMDLKLLIEQMREQIQNIE